MKQPKKCQTYPFSNPRIENAVPKSKCFFFSVQTRRLQESFQGSHSSLAYSSGELSRATVAASGSLMHFLILGVKRIFWAIILVPDMLESQARALSTREIIYFPKQVWSKILAHSIGVHGLSNWSKKQKKLIFRDPPRRTPHPNLKILFSSNQEVLLHPLRVWTTL